jgi:serine/threonine-protein kinase
MSTWCNYFRCEEAWEFVSNLPSGGQAAAKLGRLSSGEATAFLKLLSRQTDAEHRARFFREATAYDTCKHAGIPRLIQSNAHARQ